MKLPYTSNPYLYMLRWNRFAHAWNLCVIRGRLYVQLYAVGCAVDLMRLANFISPNMMREYNKTVIAKHERWWRGGE